jgi:hypothetical protein
LPGLPRKIARDFGSIVSRPGLVVLVPGALPRRPRSARRAGCWAHRSEPGARGRRRRGAARLRRGHARARPARCDCGQPDRVRAARRLRRREVVALVLVGPAGARRRRGAGAPAGPPLRSPGEVPRDALAPPGRRGARGDRSAWPGANILTTRSSAGISSRPFVSDGAPPTRHRGPPCSSRAGRRPVRRTNPVETRRRRATANDESAASGRAASSDAAVISLNER